MYVCMYVYLKLYITMISLAIFIIPAIIIAVCYASIVGVIWRQSSSSIMSSGSVPTASRRHRRATKTSSFTWGNDIGAFTRS